MKNIVYTFCLLLSANLLHAQLGVNPNVVMTGQSLTVTFTDPVGRFSTGSPCSGITASNVTFEKPGGTSFQPSAVTIKTPAKMEAQVNIPGAADLGLYNITFSGGCPLACTNCFTVQNTPPPVDLRITLLQTVFPTVSGGSLNFRIRYYNDSFTPVNGTIKFAYDSRLIYNSSSVTPTSHNLLDTLTWSVGSIPAQSFGTIWAYFTVPSPVITTTTYNTTALILPVSTDLDPADNTADTDVTVTGSSTPTLFVDPDNGNQAQSLNVRFTSPSITFGGASSTCGSLSPADVIFTAPSGTYSFQASAVNIINPDTAQVTIDIPFGAPLGAYDVVAGTGVCEISCADCFTVNSVPPGPNLLLTLSGSPAVVKGEEATYTIQYKNIGTTTINNSYLKISRDPQFRYLTSSIPYSALATDSIAWNLGTLSPGASGTIVLKGRYDGNNYGSLLRTITTLYPVSGDIVPANNADTLDQLIKKATLLVLPDTGETSQTLAVKFTGATVNFMAASSCTDPSNIRFTHESSAFSFNPVATNLISSDTLAATLGIPSNSLLGYYDVEFLSGCPVKCENCFFVEPDTVVTGDDLAVYLTAITSARPGYNVSYQITYQNKGSDTADVDLRLGFDGNLNYQNSVPVHDNQVADTLYWTIQDIEPGTYGSVQVNFDLPASVPLSTGLISAAYIEPLTGDLDPSDNVDTLVQVVTGSYDPNDKQVTPDGFIPLGFDELTYVVRFQNTGTAAADKVVIVDTLSASLDVSTFRTVAASHGYSYELLQGSPAVVRWTFLDINLPDSTTDWLGSQGFVRYEISPVSGLKIRDSILNAADIYFDFNAPIRTNTAANYLFDCDSLANFEIAVTDLCVGDTIFAYYSGFGATGIYWDLSGELLDSIQDLNALWEQGGSYTLNLTASNAFCSDLQSVPVEVNDPPVPLITVTGDQLVSSVSDSIRWYFNGTLLSGATNDTLIAEENGWYYVSHLSEEGCESISDSVEITIIGIRSYQAAGQLSIYPNPAKGKLKVQAMTGEVSSAEMEVYHITGRLVMKQQLNFENAGQSVEVDLTHLTSGVYLFKFNSGPKPVLIRVVVLND